MNILEKRLYTKATCGAIRVLIGLIYTEYGNLEYKQIEKDGKKISFSDEDFDWFRIALLRNTRTSRCKSGSKFKFLIPCCLKNFVIMKTISGVKTAIEITPQERDDLLQCMFCDVSPHYDYLKYRSEEARKKSFLKWSNTNVSINDLAAAAFYFTGYDDIVRCFRCGKIVFDWEAGDDPIKDHRRLSPTCSFLEEKERSEKNHGETTPAEHKIVSNGYYENVPTYSSGADVCPESNK